MYNKEEFKQVVENAVKEIFPDREVTTLVEDRSYTEQLRVEAKIFRDKSQGVSECGYVGSKNSDAKELEVKVSDNVSTLFDFNRLEEIHKQSGIEGVKDFIKSCIDNCENNLEEIQSTIKNFKSMLNIKVFDPIVKPHLKNCITKDLGDLKQALVLAKNGNNNAFQIYLSKDNLDRFKTVIGDMTLEDLWDLAQENLKKCKCNFLSMLSVPGFAEVLQDEVLSIEDLREPTIIFTTNDLQTEETIRKMQDLVTNCKLEQPMFIIENRDLSYSTSLLCNEELLSGLSKVFNESYYILPSSTLELILFPESFANPLSTESEVREQLKEIVFSVNQTLPGGEVFTNEVFKYDKSVEKLEFVGKYERFEAIC